MRTHWNARLRADYLSDALAHLAGWTQEDRQLRRTYMLDDAQHADLTERIKVCADALRLRAELRRLDGHTQIKVTSADGTAITDREVALAARIEDAYRAVTSE